MSNTEQSSTISKLFLAGAAISSINCLARADFNLPIFIFSYLVWNLDVILKNYIFKYFFNKLFYFIYFSKQS